MQINKTYIYVFAGLAVMAGLTGWLVFKAPAKPGQAAADAAAEGLNKPRAIAFAKDGSLIIVDSKNNRLEVRKPSGKVERVGKLGAAKGEFREPCGVAVDKAGNVFVADTFHTMDPNGGLPWGRIQKLDDDYDFKAEFGKVEAAPNELFGPRAIAIDGQDRVWLSDTGNGRLLVYDNDGKFIEAVGKKGKKELEFDEPFGIGFDDQGNAYVADRLNFRIQVISKDFKFVRQFKVDGWEATQINQEPYVAVDSKRGYVWVSDPTKKKVHRYNLMGKEHLAVDKGFDGPAAAPFSLPTGLAVKEDGTVYVSDGGLARVLTIKP